MNMTQLQQLTQNLKGNIGKAIMGKDEQIEKILLALYSGGHILLEDIPGTGKTTMAKALARSLDCQFKRVQFTPDLLPSEVTGINFYNQKEQQFQFKPGAIFTNILLADEINRATPRTQSSLLECMEERQCSVDGVTYQMESPFLVIATQNPVEIQGTFPLPEAQLDRFFMKLSLGYPGAEQEKTMLTAYRAENPLAALEPVCSKEQVLEAQQLVSSVKVGDAVAGYMVALAEKSRSHEKIRLGISPRGVMALMRASQAKAAIEGRDFVLPDDVKAVFADVCAHRIIC
ncbi:MAG: MoxR family ATPase, partial [Oscillospiraceae bacterium]|nr:MoxR family ATPase [Oscillospiraceae bacterium]